MKATVLVDNYVPNKYELIGEPSFSCLLESNGVIILFDLGYSKIPYDNAKKLKLDLKNIDYIVLSHGHLDHTWGLKTLLSSYSLKKEVKFICHPDALKPKIYDQDEIGIREDEKFLARRFKLIKTVDPLWINSKTVFLGEIKRSNNFENKWPVGKMKSNENYQDDFVLDDSAIAYRSDNGIVIITGCSHSGICNIIEYSKSVLQCEKINTIIGGLHLQNENENDGEILLKTIDYLKKENISIIYPCHCTNMSSRIQMSRIVNIGEIGAGTTIEF